MRHLPLFALALGVGLASTVAQARTARCVLEVDHRTYLDGPCEFTVEDAKGSFTIGVGQTRRSRYFAYVDMDDDGAHGYWNATPDASHAHTSLGLLTRDGACWKNASARVCAYR